MKKETLFSLIICLNLENVADACQYSPLGNENSSCSLFFFISFQSINFHSIRLPHLGTVAQNRSGCKRITYEIIFTFK